MLNCSPALAFNGCFAWPDRQCPSIVATSCMIVTDIIIIVIENMSSIISIIVIRICLSKQQKHKQHKQQTTPEHHRSG